MLELIKDRIKKDNKSNYFGLYKCHCGIEKVILNHSVRSGTTRSCGCLKRSLDIIKAAKMRLNPKHSKTHGMEHTREYTSWDAMKTRCNNPNHKSYHRYGGGGITFCASWNRFENFFADMGYRPINTSLDRINNDGNYEPSNCRWADPHTQRINKSTTSK